MLKIKFRRKRQNLKKRKKHLTTKGKRCNIYIEHLAGRERENYRCDSNKSTLIISIFR